MNNLYVCPRCKEWRSDPHECKEPLSSDAVLGDGWRDARKVDPADKTLVIIFSVNHEWNVCMFSNGLYLGEYQEFLDVIAWMPVSELGTPTFA